MSYTEQLCWAFDTVPSRINVLYWKYTFKDLKFKLRIRAGHEMSKHAQSFEILAKVVSQALGGSKSKSEQKVKPIQTADQALQQFAAVFG